MIYLFILICGPKGDLKKKKFLMINNNDYCEDICLVYLFIYFYLLDIREYKILFCVDYTVYLFKCNISSFINEVFILFEFYSFIYPFNRWNILCCCFYHLLTAAVCNNQYEKISMTILLIVSLGNYSNANS